MAGDTHGDKAQEEPEAQEGLGQQQAVQDQPQVSSTDWRESPLSSPCSMAFRSLLSSLQYAFLLFFYANSRSFPSGGPDARRSGKDALSCKTHPNACG